MISSYALAKDLKQNFKINYLVEYLQTQSLADVLQNIRFRTFRKILRKTSVAKLKKLFCRTSTNGYF